jgi:hypothetical protein
MGARDEKRLLRFQKQLAKYSLLTIDELGFVPLSKTGALQGRRSWVRARPRRSPGRV